MKQIITIKDGEIRLNSNLDEYSFGKTDYESIVTQEGVIFDSKDDSFTAWTFSDVKSFQVEGQNDRIVFYCGKNALSDSSKTLLEFLEDGGEPAFKAGKAVIQALTQAAKNKRPVPMNGAGGIMVDISPDQPKVLFLPEGLFKYSANGLSPEEYLQLQGGWINQTIYDLPAVCFERAVIAYKLLTGRFPYPATDPIERNADILDRKFLPMELCINGIDSELAKQINKALKLNSSEVNIPGKKQKGKGSEDLTPTADFPIDLLEPAWKLSKEQGSSISNKDFEEKAAAYIKLRDSKINTKRKLRRNYATIITVAIVAVVLAVITNNAIQSNKNEYTSKGLTSTQTIQSYFIGVNAKLTTMLSNIVKGKKPQHYIDTVSQIYVLGKQRQVYDKDNGFATVENWLLFATNAANYEKSGIYGITNLKIDEKPVELDIKVYRVKDNPPPVTEEGNVSITEKSTSVHKVQYYLIHSEGENNTFVVEEVSEIFTLTYLKGRWRITDINTDSTVLPVKCSAFKNDYFNQLAVNNGDAEKSIHELRGKYPWLPTDTAIANEKKLEEYNALNPFDQLDFLSQSY